MAVIRFEGEKKSWSEQNKERVWAAVTSCLTNVPPTLKLLLLLLRGCCCCCPGPIRRLLATRARSTVAWGGFLATLSSEHTQPPEGWEPPSGVGGTHRTRAPHSCLASLSFSPGTAQGATAARVLGDQTPELTES